MGYSNGIVVAPVGIGDVRNAISHSSGDLGTLIMNGNINMWSKYKPVVRANLIDTTDQWDFTNSKWKSSATWWKADDGSCGLRPYGTSQSFYTLINATDGSLNGWSYVRPTGGLASPFRLLDFARYKSDAVPFVTKFKCDEKIQPGQDFQASCLVNDSDENIAIGDISTFQGRSLYFGILIYNPSNGTVLARGTTSTAGTAYIEARFPTSIQTGLSLRCYPFFSDTAISFDVGDTKDGGIICYTVPTLNYQTFQTVTQLDPIALRANRITPTRISVTATNRTATDYTLGLQARFPGKNWNDALVQGEFQQTVTLQGLATSIYNFTQLTSGQSYEILVYVNQTGVTYRLNPLSPLL